jgi:hypothetical protein
MRARVLWAIVVVPRAGRHGTCAAAEAICAAAELPPPAAAAATVDAHAHASKAVPVARIAASKHANDLGRERVFVIGSLFDLARQPQVGDRGPGPAPWTENRKGAPSFAFEPFVYA